jgi:hypothetical protein
MYLHEPESHVISSCCVDFDVFSLVKEVQAVGVVDDSDGSLESSIAIDLNPEKALKFVHFGSGLFEPLFSGVGIGFF